MNKTANRLSDMEFDEVSLVTRPANQMSKVMLFKSDTNVEEDMSDADVIETEDDAVVEKAKRKSMPKMEIEVSTEDDEEMMDDEEEMPMKKKGYMKKDEDSSDVQIPSEVYEYIEALEAANDELLSTVEKMQEEAEAEAEAVEEEILKSADPRLVEIVKAAEERAYLAEQIAKAERDYRLEREFIAKADTLGNLAISAEDFGLVLKNIADSISEEDFDTIWQVLSAANESVAKSGIFEEVGKSVGANDSDSPMNVIEKAAARIMNDNPSLSKEQAVAKALEADATLYTQYIREGR